MEIGSRIAELRKKKKLSQKDFSQIFNISTGAVGMWETDKRKPDLDMLIQLADYFDVSVDYILCRECKHVTNIDSPSSHEEHLILDTFRKLNSDNQYIIIGKAKELLKEQQIENNFPKDTPLKKVE